MNKKLQYLIFVILIASSTFATHLNKNGKQQKAIQENETELIQEVPDIQPVEWETVAYESHSFEEFYNSYKEALSQNLQTAQHALNEKNAECNSYKEEVERATAEKNQKIDYVIWLQEKIATNQAKIEKIFAERCEAHEVFIEYYKNAKVTLSLLAFLENALENYSLAQLQQVNHVLVQLYDMKNLKSRESMKVILAQFKAIDDSYETGSSLNDRQVGRTEEQIGDDHVDDNRERIDLEDYDSSDRQDLGQYKQQLISIIVQLRTQINSEIERRQNNEIELNDKVVEFVSSLETEIKNLSQEVETQQGLITQLDQTSQTNAYLYETCMGEVGQIEDLVDVQQSNLDYANNNKEELQALFQSTAQGTSVVAMEDADDNNEATSSVRVN